MKKLSAIIMALLFLFSATACEIPPTPEIPVADVLKNPSSYLGHSAIFKSGTVVFKKQTKDTSVIVVVSHPFPKVRSVANLHESEVLPIKVTSADYKNITIGSIVTAYGHIERAEKKDKTVYYIDTQDITVVGYENIDDPDFEKLVEAINQKVKDDEFFFTVIFFYFIIMPLLFNN